MSNNEPLTEIIVACCNGNCPRVYLDQQADPSRAVLITDDFNNEIRMSREQFKIMIELARNIPF